MASHFLAIRGRPANGDDIPALMTAACLAAGCWPNGPQDGEPTDYWLATLPGDTPIARPGQDPVADRP